MPLLTANLRGDRSRHPPWVLVDPHFPTGGTGCSPFALLSCRPTRAWASPSGGRRRRRPWRPAASAVHGLRPASGAPGKVPMYSEAPGTACQPATGDNPAKVALVSKALYARSNQKWSTVVYTGPLR